MWNWGKKVKKFFLHSLIFLSLSNVNAVDTVDLKTNESDLDELVRNHSGEIEEIKYRIKIIEQNLGISHQEKIHSKNSEQIEEDIRGKSPDEIIEKAKDLINIDKCQEARDILNAFIKQNPRSLHCGRMHFYIGQSYFMEKDYQKAAKSYMESFEINPSGTKTPKALFRLSQCFFKLGKQNQRRVTLEKLALTFPKVKYGKKAIAKLNELKKS